MRIIVGIVVGILLTAGCLSAVSGSASRDCRQMQFIKCQVNTGDNLWSIAAALTGPQEDIREVMFLIRAHNGLGNNAQIYPGQILLVPVKNHISSEK